MSSPENVKVVLLGEPGVGKTCIITRFISDEFSANTISSMCAQFLTKSVDFIDVKKTIKFEIWDTAGQERFHSLAKIFYRDAKVICLVYDVTIKQSFEKMKSYWYQNEVKLNAEGNPFFAVVGNKFDLYESRQVQDEEALEFAKSINAIFQYTSAKESSGIDELFNKIGNKYFNPDLNIIDEETKEREKYEQKKLRKEKMKDENNITLVKEDPKNVKKKCC